MKVLSSEIRFAELADGILLGSGDSQYFPAEAESFHRFLTWYVHHGIGNAITFRPIYRWVELSVVALANCSFVRPRARRRSAPSR